jgi:predicted DNA-binding transcriptional regulator AlpA
MSDQPLETLIDEKHLAQKLRVSIATLRNWRMERKGPRFHKIGQLIRYAPSDIRDWLLRRQAGGDLQQAEVAR